MDQRPRALVPAQLVRGGRGAVVAPHPLATSAGAAILRQGGNAVDAAIATNAALAVVAANWCGIGGDAFWLIWSAKERRQRAINGSGRSPRGLDAAALRRRGLRALPLRGALTITVPGAVRSWGDAHKAYGRLPFEALLAPAIELAEAGFPAWPGWIHSIEVSEPIFAATLAAAAEGWRREFMPDGRSPRPGERIRRPALGRTLRRIATAGAADFYEGEIGERQARALAAAGSAIGPGDLRDHRSSWTEPIATSYRGVVATSHPPNSSGVVALELLNVLERFDPPPASAFGIQGSDVRWTHLMIEAAKLALADRDRWLADPAFREVPTDRLLDKSYAETLAARIDPRKAAGPGAAGVPVGGGTVYLAAADADGNAVSLIQSNYMGFGSGIADPETGIAYQNRGSYFSLDPDHPNVLEPSKRPLHTLLPGMLFRDGSPWVVAGSMGGDAQPIIHGQLVSALVDGQLDVATSVAAPRVSVEADRHFGPRATVVAEPRFGEGLREALEAMGHHVERAEPFDARLGHCHAIEIVEGGPAAGGTLAAATDPRCEGLPAVL